MNSIILCARVAPVDPSDTDKVVVCAPPAIDCWVNPPDICSKICKFVLVFVLTHLANYHRFPKILPEFYQFDFCLAEQLGTNNSPVEFLEIHSAATAYMHIL